MHRYFWPDTPPYASMLRTIAEHLASEGHEVHVFTAQPSYGGSDKHETRPKNERLGEVTVTRARLLSERPSQLSRRAVNLVMFAAQVAVKAMRRREYDVVMAATTPPILVALAARLASHAAGAKFVYHMQDIYPEVLAANRHSRFTGRIRLLRWIDALTTRRADRIVVLSRDMKETLGMRHATENVRVINNFLPDKSHSKLSAPNQTKTRWKADSYQVVFAGNLGNFQGLDKVVAAFKVLSESRVAAHLVLLGSGVAELALREQADTLLDDVIFFPGRVTQSEAEMVVSSSDLALVTLNEGVIGTAFPSKTMTYLSCGTPVLAAVEPWSELGEVLISAGAGSACELSSTAIAKAIMELESAESIQTEVVTSLADSYASASSRLPQWSSLIGEL